MFQGFYSLTSSVLTNTRKLDVISNNMANAGTSGYKSDQFIAKSFEDEIVSRSQNKDQIQGTEIGSITRGVQADRTYTDFSNAGMKVSTHPLDFAITSNGFFELDGPNGIVYSRNGSFSLDGEGFLVLQGVGRVMDQNGGHIYLGTDNVSSDTEGSLFDKATGANLGQIAIRNFANYETDLEKSSIGIFTPLAQPVAVEGRLRQNMLELSNTDAVKEMSEMMATQRSLQGSAQVLTMYDQLMAKIVNQLGPNS